jgi:hypothetical protein
MIQHLSVVPKAGMVLRYYCKHPSHSWQNGLYVVVKVIKRSKLVYLSKLRDDQLNVPSTGTYDYNATSYDNNPDLYPTRLTYKLEKGHLPK